MIESAIFPAILSAGSALCFVIEVVSRKDKGFMLVTGALALFTGFLAVYLQFGA